jgi:hypothetical protein
MTGNITVQGNVHSKGDNLVVGGLFVPTPSLEKYKSDFTSCFSIQFLKQGSSKRHSWSYYSGNLFYYYAHSECNSKPQTNNCLTALVMISEPSHTLQEYMMNIRLLPYWHVQANQINWVAQFNYNHD